MCSLDSASLKLVVVSRPPHHIVNDRLPFSQAKGANVRAHMSWRRRLFADNSNFLRMFCVCVRLCSPARQRWLHAGRNSQAVRLWPGALSATGHRLRAALCDDGQHGAYQPLQFELNCKLKYYMMYSDLLLLAWRALSRGTDSAQHFVITGNTVRT
jgi:hypothetical protein